MKTPETSKKSSNSTKNKFLAFGIGLVFAFLALEVLTRLLLWMAPDLFLFEKQDKEFLIENPYWKVWHYANSEARHQLACFDVTYHTNSWGMKGGEIDTSKYKIALLGDSYIEGYGEGTMTTMPYYLDSLAGPDNQIMNFGTSGGYGTVHQYAIYENFVRHFKPDVVVLFFLSYNDLYDNVNAISEGFIDKEHNFTFPRTNNLQEVRTMLDNQPQPELRETGGWFVAPKLIDKSFASLQVALHYMLNTKVDFKAALGEVYSPNQSETLDEGYEIFKKSLKEIKAAVERDGAEFLLVQSPTPFQIDPKWLEISGDKLDTVLEPEVPNKRVAEITDELGIAMIDALPAAMSYIEENEMPFPYLYHSCDRHFNSEGNLWFAQEINGYLQANGLLK